MTTTSLGETMGEPRRIAVATFGRSDFSILRPLCSLLDKAADFSVGLWVGGAHFEDVSGRTVTDIESSGLPIWARIDGGEYERSELGTVEMMARQMSGFAAVAADPIQRPDLVLILGDRFEAIAAGLAMVPLGVPVGHISGGSVTEGAIDDVFRHCLTKIAAIHFCDLPRFARRIQFMGEQPERIFTTGALGLDAFAVSPPRPFGDFAEQFALGDLEPGYLLATLHPESGHPDQTLPMTNAFVEALVESSRPVIVTYPNADPGSDVVIQEIESAAATHAHIRCVRGFGAEWFPSAMAHAGMMVGNSSSGIIEAASFGLPVVDIGERQKGRDHGPNVIHCGRTTPAISAAIERASTAEFVDISDHGNIYGDGRGRDRVLAALLQADWTQLGSPKRFADPDPAFGGELLAVA